MVKPIAFYENARSGKKALTMFCQGRFLLLLRTYKGSMFNANFFGKNHAKLSKFSN